MLLYTIARTLHTGDLITWVHWQAEQPRMACLAMSEMTTYRWSFDEDAHAYHAAGVSAIGVWRHKLADHGEQRGAELLRSLGLQVSSLQWAGGFTGSDGRSHQESLEDGREAIHLAAALKAGCLIVHSGARGVHTQNHARRLFRSALDRLLPLANQLGVTLAIEPMCRDCGADWTFLNSLDEAIELASHYHHPRLKLVLDTYLWGRDPSLLSTLPDLMPHVALVQLGDARHPPRAEQNRLPLGEGDLPLNSIVAAASACGYDGCYEVELVGEEIEALDYVDVLKRSLRAFDAWTNDLPRQTQGKPA